MANTDTTTSMDTRLALNLALELLDQRNNSNPLYRQAAKRLRQVRQQRGMSELSPGDPDSLPEFIDVAIDG